MKIVDARTGEAIMTDDATKVSVLGVQGDVVQLGISKSENPSNTDPENMPRAPKFYGVPFDQDKVPQTRARWM